MIVVLLLLIAAILLFGASTILKLGGAVLKFAVALLALSLFLAFWRGLNGQGWWLMVAGSGVVALALAVIWARGSSDERLLATEEGRQLRAAGKSAQETVDELRQRPFRS